MSEISSLSRFIYLGTYRYHALGNTIRKQFSPCRHGVILRANFERSEFLELLKFLLKIKKLLFSPVMKREMHRKSKKWIKILKNNGFRVPYQILADNSFLKLVNKLKIEFSAFKNLFKSEPKFFLTSCAYESHKKSIVSEEKNNLYKDFSGQCQIIKCSHDINDGICTYSFIKDKNPHHYILATNNTIEIKKFRESEFLPLLRVIRNIPQIDCCKINSEARVFLGDPAKKKELRRLKKLLD